MDIILKKDALNELFEYFWLHKIHSVFMPGWGHSYYNYGLQINLILSV